MPLRPNRPLRLLAATLTTSFVLASPAAATVDHANPEHNVGELLDTLGLAWGNVVNSWDLRDASATLGVELTEPAVPYVVRKFGLDEMDVWRNIFVRLAEEPLRQAQRDRLREPAVELGLDPGTVVDESDVRRLAEHLDLDLGHVVSPLDVHNVDVIARREAGVATPVMARVGDFTLRAPGHDVRGVGFHEAPSGEQRFSMTPAEARGVIMASRGRSSTPTSAVDVAMPAGTEVVAPIDGVVSEVVRYRLYGKYDDAFLRINGAGRDVVVLHLQGLKVRAGQRVVAGVTPIADGPRVFPFGSQIEDLVGRVPHVDISVRPNR